MGMMLRVVAAASVVYEKWTHLHQLPNRMQDTYRNTQLGHARLDLILALRSNISQLSNGFKNELIS